MSYFSVGCEWVRFSSERCEGGGDFGEVGAYVDGITIRALAEQFCLGTTSVKRILRAFYMFVA
jgi:hypothetical protein